MSEPRHRITQAIESPSAYGLRQWSGWFIGPALLLVTLLLPPPEGLSVEGWRTAGVAMLMATWWISESLPIPATALLPLVLLPALGLNDIRAASSPYANPLIFLFLGGFVIALAMQRWNLHRRVALALIGLMGTRPRGIVAGFLLAAALVSMWVSNTATALMMLPIAISVVQLVPESSRDQPQSRAFATALVLAVAYGATTGGMATLIGTPPNALLAGYVTETYGLHLGFAQWMLIGLPVTLIGLPIVYLVLTRVAFRLPSQEMPGMRDLMRDQRGTLGRLSYPEAAVAVVFALTATCWVFHPLLKDQAGQPLLPMLSDTTIAIAGALALFVIPVNLGKGEFIMDWEHARQLPWDVLILFGGGLSLASVIERHGLAGYLGSLFGGMDAWPVVLSLAAICFGILMLTELTSNTATAATFLPITGAIAMGIGQSPLFFLIPTALAANCSYMMPVGTPPNAIVFGSGMVRLPDMARTGLLLNLLFVPLIVLLVLLLGPYIFGAEMDQIQAMTPAP
jgi:sodium-dependent dicarboxylate transporter 2/3/5